MNNFTESVTSKNVLLTDKFSRIAIRFRIPIRAVSGQYDAFRSTVHYIRVSITNMARLIATKLVNTLQNEHLIAT